ncbi:MAG: threonine/serine exporter family protein [Fusobacterium perfoetens]|uniref:threonine/serine ThrE exporter family protein n=1 Tax=Fusobacterium perfoetens TaxID=852 RepID=UPI0023F14DDB|nr:threonine/serine exporter family protein [Fusobacterium perfoetens]MCI6152658.1 threonine/serine exporter family protein [Fusobacterium perfoetens]MDY3237690.1 threonine/serine exporter family protein [Fusobacterium perfoetens]
MDKEFEYRVLNLAGDIGENLLKNGSEVYRVENSVCTIANYFGFFPQCFATLTCIIITFENSQGEIISLVRRVKNRGTNLDKIYKISSLIKNIKNYNIESFEITLKNIIEEKPNNFIINTLGFCLGSSFFSILFLGKIEDFIASLISGFIVAIFSKLSDKLILGSFFTNLLCGFIATTSACFFQYIGFISETSITIISTLMILVPGVAFINSMRDIFSGDLVTGISRLLEVVMIGTSIAIGSGIALKLFLH